MEYLLSKISPDCCHLPGYHGGFVTEQGKWSIENNGTRFQVKLEPNGPPYVVEVLGLKRQRPPYLLELWNFAEEQPMRFNR